MIYETRSSNYNWIVGTVNTSNREDYELLQEKYEILFLFRVFIKKSIIIASSEFLLFNSYREDAIST